MNKFSMLFVSLFCLALLVSSVSATVATIYPVHDGGFSADGSSLTWTALTEMTTAAYVWNNQSGTYNSLEIDAGSSTDRFMNLRRHVFTFRNLSAELGIVSSINSAYLTWTGEGGENLFSGFNGNYVLVAGNPDNPLTLVEGDFDAISRTALSGVNSSTLVSGYKIVLPLNSAGLTFLETPNNGVYNTFYLIYDDDRSQTFSGTWSSGKYAYEFVKALKDANIDNRPKLVIDFESAVAPVASFTPSSWSAPTPANVSFTDTSTNTPTSWFWVFGDGNTSTVQNPYHIYESAGVYYANLTATNAGGSNTSGLHTITIGDAPTGDFTKDVSVGANPLTVNFNGAGFTGTGTLSYFWVFGDGNTSTSVSPTHIYNTGTWYANVTVSNAFGSIETVTQSITVGVPPTVSFTRSPSYGAEPHTVNFVNTGSGGTSWNWSFGDGTYAETRNTSHSYYVATGYDDVYYPTLTTTNAFGSVTSTAVPATNVGVGKPVTANFTVSNNVGLSPLNVTFTKTSLNATWVKYDWENNGTWSAALTSTTGYHVYTIPGNYTVRQEAYNAYNHSFVTKTEIVSVVYPPIIDNIVCNITSGTGAAPPNLNVTFSVAWSGGTPDNFDWYIDGIHTSSINPEVSFSAPGVYLINASISNIYGFDTYNTTYSVLGKPPNIISYSVDHLSGSELSPTSNITFEVGFDTTSYGTPTSILWAFGDGGTSNTNPAHHIFTTSGVFSGTVIASNVWGSDQFNFTYDVPAGLFSTVKWTNEKGSAIGSAYVGDTPSFVFDTNNKGTIPPSGYIQDYFAVEFFKQDISTGNWILQLDTVHFNAMIVGVNTTLYLHDSPFPAGGIYSWKGYADFDGITEGVYKGRLISYNITNTTMYPPIILGSSEIAIVQNPLLVENVGGWADDLGGAGLKLIIALLIVIGFAAAPFIITREFNTYIEVFMIMLGIGVGYFAGLVDLWVVAGLVILASVSIFFMARGGGGGSAEGSEGSEMG